MAVIEPPASNVAARASNLASICKRRFSAVWRAGLRGNDLWQLSLSERRHFGDMIQLDVHFSVVYRL
jgi:hypothetical protein